MGYRKADKTGDEKLQRRRVRANQKEGQPPSEPIQEPARGTPDEGGHGTDDAPAPRGRKRRLFVVDEESPVSPGPTKPSEYLPKVVIDVYWKDPIYKEDGKWFFKSPTGKQVYGPYKSEYDARECLHTYCRGR